MWVRPRYARAALAAKAAAARGPSHTAAAAAAMGHAADTNTNTATTTTATAAAPTLRQVRRQGYARARPLLRAALLLLAGLAATALPVLALGAASAAAAALGATSAAAAAPGVVAAATGTPGGAAGGALKARRNGNNSSNSSSTGGNATAAQAVASPAAAPPPPAAVASYVRLPPTAPELTQPPDPAVWHVYGGCVPRVQNPGSPDSAPGAPGFAVYCVAPAAGAAAAGAGAGGAAAGGGRNVSFWHDVPLGLKRQKASSSSSNSSSSSSGKSQEQEGEEVTFWVTNEIPRGTNAKIETQTSLPYNPMMQSTLKEQRQLGGPSPPPDQLRYYRVGPSLVNYGGIPQTWEASDVPDPVTGLPSDNDPLDYLEVGGAVLPVGGVVRVRLLGALTMVDDNQTDWKMLVVNVKDPAGWRDVADLPPARRQQLYEFFRTYKIAEGKPPVTYFLPATNTTTAAAADWAGAFVGRAAAAAVLTRKHAEWRRLLAGGCSSDACAPLTAAVAAEYGPTWREQGLGQRLAAAGAGGGKGGKAATRARGDAAGGSGGVSGVVPGSVRKS
ncbi:hypothetical protein CHLRE_09g390200v5 [Chlamydomonas reinhardtii]|uniref:inorganic diphosphatase n=1 Tax=Chlamydomonas reinhardtii TaxID=3055 RepID=A0A2K3DDK6_CHLRE|nr:uncharacterized protein CHLRE_09g390200v5 [Chlamydomonas reinhardtii]PNW78606.1 hypothetical protein CHLRE_09g390200v5 [Chlamydomonas reinhardtii]